MGRSREIFSGGLAIYLALLLLILPLRWVFAVAAAVAVHELGHYLAVRGCGGNISGFRLGLMGAYLETSQLQNWQEILCILAGPAAGLLLLFLSRWFPRLAICGALQSVYNLLPVYPLDGGRVLRCAAGLLGAGERVCVYIEYAVVLAILVLSIYGAVCLRLGLLPIMIAAVLVWRVLREKYLANRRHLRYNNSIQKQNR